MSHFTVTVCIEDPSLLDEALAPFDENREVEPYRSYLDGSPSEYWATSALRKNSGLNPDDATLTWAQLAEAYNKRYGSDPDELFPGGDVPEEGAMLIDDDGHAYMWSSANQNAKWDWYVIGGRWGGYFPYREEFTQQVIRPDRRWSSPEIIEPLHCDGGPKRALDLNKKREEEAATARATYAEWRAVTAGTPDALPWSAFRENISPESGYTIEQARVEYHSQPRVQALKGTDFRWHDDAIAEFSIPEALYVERARARAVPGWATLTADGRWMEQGRMGWWAMNDATEGSRIGYWEAANAYIESLPDSMYLILVDCHI